MENAVAPVASEGNPYRSPLFCGDQRPKARRAVRSLWSITLAFCAYVLSVGIFVMSHTFFPAAGMFWQAGALAASGLSCGSLCLFWFYRVKTYGRFQRAAIIVLLVLYGLVTDRVRPALLSERDLAMALLLVSLQLLCAFLAIVTLVTLVGNAGERAIGVRR
jgi:hypothetical protein